jgi:uncharacterized protein (TIGR04222 family)
MWLMEQIPFLNLHGGAFLRFYALFVVLTLGISWLVLKASDRTSVRSLPRVPSDPDPIEIAYLAGGENNVIRVVLYDLIQRDLVEIDADSKLRPSAVSGSCACTAPREAAVLKGISHPERAEHW